jgi:hypothetical protein
MINPQLSGDVLIKHMKESYEKAERKESKINDEILSLRGMTGSKSRHFYNNLLSLEGTRYLEIGVWKGSSTCSAMFGNSAQIVCIDNFSKFEGPREEFLKNFNKFKGNNFATFIDKNCFDVDLRILPKFNIFLYDGNHDYQSHYDALKYYYDSLENVFIYIVDDWNWDYVRNGTYHIINDLGFKVLDRIVIQLTEDNTHTPYDVAVETWWNGLFVCVLQKQ